MKSPKLGHCLNYRSNSTQWCQAIDKKNTVYRVRRILFCFCYCFCFVLFRVVWCVLVCFKYRLAIRYFEFIFPWNIIQDCRWNIEKCNRHWCELTHWGLYKMAYILQTTFSHAFSDDNNSTPIQVIVWRRTGDKPLTEPMRSQLNGA